MTERMAVEASPRTRAEAARRVERFAAERARHPSTAPMNSAAIVPTGFAFVEPASAPTLPVVDSLTRKATGLWRSCSTPGRAYRGVHACTGHRCTAYSDNLEHFTPDGRPTHSLLVHYVACHRDAVPSDDLVYLAGLTAEVEPTIQELGAHVVTSGLSHE